MLAAQVQAPQAAVETKEEIAIDDFAKVELRVAQVIAAEPVNKADKLLKLQLISDTSSVRSYPALQNFIRLSKWLDAK